MLRPTGGASGEGSLRTHTSCRRLVQFEYFKTLVDGAPDAPDYGTLSLCDYVALMQHYGLNTNLLDFTDNAFIALFLALKYYTKEEITKNEKIAKEKQRDVAVYLVNPILFNLHRERELRSRESNDIDGLDIRNKNDGIIPNLSIPRNEDRYARYIYGSDALDDKYSKSEDSSDEERVLPIAVWTPRINTRIRTQSGSFIAFDLYANTFDDKIDLMNLQKEEIERSEANGYRPIIFIYKIEISKEACEKIVRTLEIMGLNQQFVYPELDKTTQRFN